MLLFRRKRRRSLSSRPPAHPRAHAAAARHLSELREGEHGTLDRIELPESDAVRIMEMGFIPGACITAGRSAPGGDPRVYRVDGSEVALRRETAFYLRLRAPRAQQESA